MGFIRQLDLPILKVQELGKTWNYERRYTSNGLVFYSAPQEKVEFHKSKYWTEVIFLPIEYETFNTDRSNYFYGYRFLIVCPGFATIVLPQNGIFPPPITNTQILFEVCRIRYFMEDDSDIDIVIDFMGDSLFPTRVVTLEGMSENIPDAFSKVCNELVDQHCSWYANKRI